MQAMDIKRIGAIKVTQFLAAACDKRSRGACTLKDKPALQQCIAAGLVDIAAFIDLLTDLDLAVPAEAVWQMVTSAGLSVKDSQVKLQDLEVSQSAQHYLVNNVIRMSPSSICTAEQISPSSLSSHPSLGRFFCT